VEARLGEESVIAQERVEGWREMLIEMRVQAQQQSKRCQALLKQRNDEIKHLKHQI
jgi:hypothetical protein